MGGFHEEVVSLIGMNTIPKVFKYFFGEIGDTFCLPE